MSAEGQKTRLKRLALKALAVAAVFVAVPPLAWLAGDLWNLAWVADERDRDEARSLLLHSAIDSAGRVAEWRYLQRRRDLPSGAGPGPMVSTLAPIWRADEIIPVCGASGGGSDRGFASPQLATESARFMLTRERLGTAATVALDVCLNATPFAGRCERRLRRAREFTVEEIGAEAVRLKYARWERGRICWCRSILCSNEDA